MQSRSGWTAYAPLRRETPGPDRGAEGDGGDRPELADVGRLARRLVRQVVHVARAEETSIQRLLAGHLGGQAAALPVASGSWERYDHRNELTRVLLGGQAAQAGARRAGDGGTA
jgi:hypothetical protein